MGASEPPMDSRVRGVAATPWAFPGAGPENKKAADEMLVVV